MLILDWSAGEPVYEQIARQIRARIASGELVAGAALPPVRTLASDLGVNLNTVARAYRLLAEQRFVRIRERAGAEVAPPSPTPDSESVQGLAAELRELLLRLRQSGASSGEIQRLVQRELAALVS